MGGYVYVDILVMVYRLGWMGRVSHVIVIDYDYC
jgi:hypothetical protein